MQTDYGYPSGYKPKDIAEQTNCLRELFPSISYANEKRANGTLPPNAEGWFAIPKWEKIAPTYVEAVNHVLDMIRQTHGGKFCNYRAGQLGPDRIRQTAKTAKVLEKLGNEQKDDDILVVPAQFGIHHRGRSVLRARRVFASGEFGLGAFQIGIMILTHPERLMYYNDLWVDCSGDEYDDPDSDAHHFGSAPYFGYVVDRVGFDADLSGKASDSCGSASGFVPQN